MIEQLEFVDWATVPAGDGPRMTFEEFQAWYDSGHRGEWVDGEVIELRPATERHQALLIFLGSILNVYASVRGIGKVILAPFEMRKLDGGSYREPDVSFVAKEHDTWLDGKRLDGRADLAVEIVSSSSVVQDRRNKFIEYPIAGITEYRIVDPGRANRRSRHINLLTEPSTNGSQSVRMAPSGRSSCPDSRSERSGSPEKSFLTLLTCRTPGCCRSRGPRRSRSSPPQSIGPQPPDPFARKN